MDSTAGNRYKNTQNAKTARAEYAKKLVDELKSSGRDPYFYISDALQLMINGDYKASMLILDYAALLQGVYYPAESKEDSDYKLTIELFRHMLNDKPDDFRELMIGKKSAC